MINIVYAFQYCPCVHESSYGVVSLHRTQKGAEMALEFHRNMEQQKYDEYHKEISEDISDFPYDFGQFEGWRVKKIEIQD